MRLAAIGTVFVLIWGSIGQAAPLKVETLPAETKWVVHLDVDALADSIVVQKYFHEWLKKGGKKHLAKVEADTGVDLRHELHSLTLFNMGYEENVGLLVVRADMDRALLVSKAEQAPDSKMTKYGDYQLYTWTDRGKKMTGAFFKDDVLVFGSNVELVKRALDTLSPVNGFVYPMAENVELVKRALDALSGDEPGLAAPPEDKIPAGTILVGSVWGLTEAELPPKVKLPDGTEQISIVIGEHEGTSFVGGEVVATEETAGRVKEILEGLRALGILRANGDLKAKKFLERVKIKQTGKKVRFGVRVPSVEVIKGIEEHKARGSAAKKGKRSDEMKDNAKAASCED